MDQHHFKVVFDVVQAGFRQRDFPLNGLYMVGIGICIIIFGLAFPAKMKALKLRFFPYFFTGFAAIWTFMAYSGTYTDYLNLSAALRNGNFQIVEGPVIDFVPMPKEGHAMEHFRVNGHYYEYSDFVVSAGFNNTASHGGPIHEGLYVRIWDVQGEIARLAVAE